MAVLRRIPDIKQSFRDVAAIERNDLRVNVRPIHPNVLPRRRVRAGWGAGGSE
jgi:hypothetical protein